MQGARERDVVDVVTGYLCERPVLTPAGDPAVDEARVPLEADVRAEAKAFDDARAKPLNQRV